MSVLQAYCWPGFSNPSYHCFEPKEVRVSTTTDPATLRDELDRPFSLSPDQIQFFRTNGYIKLKQVLSPELLEYYGTEITNQVIQLNTLKKPMSQRNTYERAFLQITNLWTKSSIVREFVFSKRLARVATELMGTRGVRLYHDQALYKEASGGITPWHADQYYWTLSNANTCTVWVPLQQTPREMGPLAFAVGSQHFTFGRDLVISDESEEKLQAALKQQNFPHEESPFDLGEVSYHYGWTYHHAGPNTSGTARRVMTVIYMDSDMRLVAPQNNAQENDRKAWMPDTPVGDIIDAPLTPILWHE